MKDAAISWPRARPSAAKTSHGVVKTTACARCYLWLKANGVGLWTFSTDQCVECVIGRLQEMYAWTEAPTARTLGACNDVELIAVRAQLRCVMQRRPINRVRASEVSR